MLHGVLWSLYAIFVIIMSSGQCPVSLSYLKFIWRHVLQRIVRQSSLICSKEYSRKSDAYTAINFISKSLKHKADHAFLEILSLSVKTFWGPVFLTSKQCTLCRVAFGVKYIFLCVCLDSRNPKGNLFFLAALVNTYRYDAWGSRMFSFCLFSYLHVTPYKATHSFHTFERKATEFFKRFYLFNNVAIYIVQASLSYEYIWKWTKSADS